MYHDNDNDNDNDNDDDDDTDNDKPVRGTPSSSCVLQSGIHGLQLDTTHDLRDLRHNH